MLAARLQIYAKSSAINSHGESELTTSFLRYLRVKLMVADEKLLSSKEQPVHGMSVMARFFSGTTGDRIEFNGYRWEIDGVRRSHRSGNISITANRIHATIEYYLQPDGLSFYLQPGGDKYRTP